MEEQFKICVHPHVDELTVGWCGEEDLLKPGCTYEDKHGSLWVVREVTREEIHGVVMTNPYIDQWSAKVGRYNDSGPIEFPLCLRRKYSAEDIRQARSKLHGLGLGPVLYRNDRLEVDKNQVQHMRDAADLELPESVDDIPVVVIDGLYKEIFG